MDVSARPSADLEPERTRSLHAFPAPLPTLAVKIPSDPGCLSSSHSPASCLLTDGERQAALRLRPFSPGSRSFRAGCVDLVPTSLPPEGKGLRAVTHASRLSKRMMMMTRQRQVGEAGRPAFLARGPGVLSPNPLSLLVPVCPLPPSSLLLTSQHSASASPGIASLQLFIIF